MRKIITLGILGILFTLILTLFWREEYRYSLPTPVPQAYEAVPLGACIETNLLSQAQPVFFHFYNPDCPCSKFNLAHFRDIYQKNRAEVQFQVWIPAGSSLENARSQLPAELSIAVDHDGSWAKRCGVYATPQAVILTPEQTLYYRGNYNSARFCTNPGTNYASLSLARIQQGQPAFDWGPLASTAYGCAYQAEPAPVLSLFWSPTKNPHVHN